MKSVISAFLMLTSSVEYFRWLLAYFQFFTVEVTMILKKFRDTDCPIKKGARMVIENDHTHP